MRELHVVAVSEDGRHVVLAATKGGKTATHRVRLDARLVAAVRGDLRTLDSPDVDLSPKQIQTRLRAGESAEDIARSAGVAITRVERFAGPVAGEMARTIDAARAGYVVRGRRGRSTRPLGEAVQAALADSARPDSVAWSTFRDDEGRWRVTVSWFARGRIREAAWWYVPGNVELSPVDTSSANLGHVDADRRATSVSVPVVGKAKTAAIPRVKATPAAKATVNTVRKPAAQPAKPTVTKTAGKKAAAPKPLVKKAAAKPLVKKAEAKPLVKKAEAKPLVKKAATKAAVKRTPAKRVVTPKTLAKKSAARASSASPSASASRPRLQVVPDSPAPRRTRAAASTAERQKDKVGAKSRASVPAWADVLLGTTPGGDH